MESEFNPLMLEATKDEVRETVLSELAEYLFIKTNTAINETIIALVAADVLKKRLAGESVGPQEIKIIIKDVVSKRYQKQIGHSS